MIVSVKVDLVELVHNLSDEDLDRLRSYVHNEMIAKIESKYREGRFPEVTEDELKAYADGARVPTIMASIGTDAWRRWRTTV